MADTDGAQPQGPPTFVTRDGQPVSGPGAPTHPVPGAPGTPVFVNADGTPAGYQAPPQGQPGYAPHPPNGQPQPPAFGTFGPQGTPAPPAIPGPPAPAGYTVAGGEPGGPVFVVPEHGHGQGPQTLDSEDRPWRWWVGPVAVIVGFGAVFALAIFLTIAFAASGADVESVFDDNTHWLSLAQDTIWVAVAMLVPFMVVRYLKPEHLGLQKRPVGRSIGVLVIVLFTFYVLAYVYSQAMGLGEDSNELLKDSGIGDTVTRDIIYVLLFTVAAPVAEELLFRSLLFRSLRDAFIAKYGTRGGVALGAVVSGVIFGAIHFGGGQDKYLPVLMILGVLLALAYHWSGTLYVPVVLHSINNTFATGFNPDSQPAADWIYVLIFLGPVISVLVLMALTKFVRATFPQERPAPPQPPVAPPVQGSPFFTKPSGPPGSL